MKRAPRKRQPGIRSDRSFQDKRAEAILFSVFTKKDIPELSPEDEAYARAAGYLPDSYPIEHDELVRQIIELRDSLNRSKVTSAFVASLSRNIVWQRSALGSFAAARQLKPHLFEPQRRADICCACGAAKNDRGALWDSSFFRIKLGGGNHLELPYIRYDLQSFSDSTIEEPVGADLRLLRRFLAGLRKSAAGKRLGQLQDLARLIPGVARQRKVLLEILAIAGVLQPKGVTGFFAEFTRTDARDPPDQSGGNDFEYPLSWWTKQDSIDEQALQYWFSDFL